MNFKDIIFRVANQSGIVSRVRDSAWRRRRLLVLCYHGISQADEHEWSPDLYLSQARLRSRLAILREEGYNILPLRAAVEGLYAGTLPARSVALTFDDGAVDFAKRAVPVLEEFNAPATVYLTTYYVHQRLPVFDTTLSYVLWRGRMVTQSIGDVIDSQEPIYADTPARRLEAWTILRGYAKQRSLSAEDETLLLERVAQCLSVDFGQIRRQELLHIMSPEMVTGLPSDLIDVQLHTHRHRTPRDQALFCREIRDNAAHISSLIPAGHVLNHFCYPSGEYYGEFLPWLRDEGVEYATTCVPDISEPSTNPLLIPRFVDTMGQSDASFRAWISGFAARLPKRAASRLDRSRL